MRIHADQERCTSAGNCARVAPELFDQRDDDGVVIVLNENPSVDLEASARDAEGLCPARAITVSE